MGAPPPAMVASWTAMLQLHLLAIGVRRAYLDRIAHWRNLAGQGSDLRVRDAQMPGLAVGASPE
jgi:hypothetical protein